MKMSQTSHWNTSQLVQSYDYAEEVMIFIVIAIATELIFLYFSDPLSDIWDC